MHESACSIREEKKTPRVFHSPSHFVIEKQEGRLLFPVFLLLHIFQQVYFMHVTEISKRPKDVDFLNFLRKIKTSNFYEMGLDQLLDEEEEQFICC